MATASPRRALDRLLVVPDTDGPRVRLGLLWFAGTLLALLGGRWTAAVWWAATAALAAVQTVRVWEPPGTRRADPVHLVAAALVAALVPLAAGWGDGLAGLVLAVGALALPAAELARGRRPAAAGAAAIAALLPAVAAASVVASVRVNLLTGVFLVGAVSMYDAGFFLLGSEARHRWEGLAGGVVGVLAVTFTMAAFRPPPFDLPSAWVVGVVLAVACPVGQWVVSLYLPSARARVPALRRLDTYVLAGPLFLACVWMLGG